MRLLWWLSCVVALSACVGNLKVCSSDGECPGGRCELSIGACVFSADGAGGAGGGGGPIVCGAAVCSSTERCSSDKRCVADQAPTLSVATPLEGAFVGPTVEVLGIATDDDVPPTVELSTDLVVWLPVPLDPQGGFVRSLALPALDNAPAALTIRARDSKGQQSFIVRALVVDSVPPMCSFTSPDAGAQLRGPTLTATMIASDGSKLSDGGISISSAAAFADVEQTDAGYAFSWAALAENGVAHELVFRIFDAAGNRCEARLPTVVDSVSPSISFNAPDAGALLGPAFFAAGGVISGSVSDGTRPLKGVTLDFDDGAGPRAATLQGGAWSLMVPAPATDDFKLHTLIARATDLADNTTSVSQAVTVDVVKPSFAITSPMSGAKLNAASFAASPDVVFVWTLTDGDSQLIVGLQLADGGTLSPPQLSTSPTDNPTAYQPVLVASDRAGNRATATVSFSVDRVAPTVTASAPANDTRMYAGKATADFSEPMTSASGLSLNQPFTGTWTTPQRFEASGLTRDTVHLASTGPATDLHGNPIAPMTPFRFHTETWTPDAGATVAMGYSEVVEAVADQEGAITFIAIDSLGSGRLVLLEPATGDPYRFSGQTVGGPRRLVSSRTINPDRSSRRITGFNMFGSQVAYVLGPGTPVAVSPGDYVIPTPPYPGEGTGRGEVGVISGLTYKRDGGPDVALALSNVNMLRVGEKFWEVSIGNSARGTDSQRNGTYFAFGTNFTILDSLVSTSNPVPALFEALAAVSDVCSVHAVYEQFGSQTVFSKWQPNCGTFGEPACIGATTRTLNNLQQLVADPTNARVFFALNTSGEIFRAALDGSCVGTWALVGAPVVNGLAAGSPQLLVVRGVPGLLFANTAGDVKFVTP